MNREFRQSAEGNRSKSGDEPTFLFFIEPRVVQNMEDHGDHQNHKKNGGAGVESEFHVNSGGGSKIYYKRTEGIIQHVYAPTPAHALMRRIN